jgi:hypothetical protein
MANRGPGWGPRAQELLDELDALLRANALRALDDASFRSELLTAVRDEPTRAFWEWYGKLPTHEQETTASVVQNTIAKALREGRRW